MVPTRAAKLQLDSRKIVELESRLRLLYFSTAWLRRHSPGYNLGPAWSAEEQSLPTPQGEDTGWHPVWSKGENCPRGRELWIIPPCCTEKGVLDSLEGLYLLAWVVPLRCLLTHVLILLQKQTTAHNLPPLPRHFLKGAQGGNCWLDWKESLMRSCRPWQHNFRSKSLGSGPVWVSWDLEGWMKLWARWHVARSSQLAIPVVL